MDADLADLSQRTGTALRERSLTLATAESCTGGWVAQIVTHTGGSSAWFERGFVTYSNDAKMEMLGVASATLAACGAVSEETAREMAAGALAHSHAGVALAITGVAGPTGGSPDKPVGTVCFAWCRRGEAPQSERRRFDGDREAVRRQSAIYALEGLLRRL
ncbi:MAG TPA: nicotinamide-nucleotide amidohydrolase family protein [Rhodocyclaceae bacterium]